MAIQLDHPLRINKKSELLKAKHNLEIAKSIPRKVVYLKPGESAEFNKVKKKK